MTERLSVVKPGMIVNADYMFVEEATGARMGFHLIVLARGHVMVAILAGPVESHVQLFCLGIIGMVGDVGTFGLPAVGLGDFEHGYSPDELEWSGYHRARLGDGQANGKVYVTSTTWENWEYPVIRVGPVGGRKKEGISPVHGSFLMGPLPGLAVVDVVSDIIDVM